MLKKDIIKCDIATIEHALKIAAAVVTKYGELYLPIFERLLIEAEKLKKHSNLKNLAEQIYRDGL